MKAFVIGFPKSGTSSLHDAFRRSGLKSVHWHFPGGYVGRIIYENYLAGKDPLAGLDAFDAIAQADLCVPARKTSLWPQLDYGVLAAIRRHHPECMFILNRRPAADTASSILRWNNFASRLVQSDVPGLPRGYGAETSHLVSWIEGHYAAASHFFKDDPAFLDLDILDPDAPKKLGDALGVEITWWGKANVNRDARPGEPNSVDQLRRRRLRAARLAKAAKAKDMSAL